MRYSIAILFASALLAGDAAAEWNKRGARFLDEGRLPEARDCLLHSLGLLKPSEPRALVALINLATVERLDRNYEESERLWLAGIETARMVKPRRIEMEALLCGYAALLRDLKREAEAKVLERRALLERHTVLVESLRK